MGIDESIDALAEALRNSGVDPPRAPAESPDLDAVEAAIAPMSLPADVRRWWERVDPWSVRAWSYPTLTSCDFALDTWIKYRDEFPAQAPLSLFLVGYESWACMGVELDSPFGPGGALFEWRLDGGAFHLRYHDLGGWLARITALLVAGEFERQDGGPAGPRLLLRDPDAALSMSELPGPGTPNAVHGETIRYEQDPLNWPLHWQRLSGLELSEIEPRGATHTIAELMSSDPSRPLVATIAAQVVALAGSGNLTHVNVTDGTGEMTISCPAKVTMLGPSMRQVFEFDVIVPAGNRVAPPDPAATAVATAVRPLSRR